jgi:hypothetical protein
MDNHCVRCGIKYSRPPALIGSYCSKQCAYADRRKSVTGVRRMRYLPTHPLAGKTGLVSEARVILFERLGPGWHSCHWCGKKVRWLHNRRGAVKGALVADHLDSNPLNDFPKNLVASCGTCNGTRTRAIRSGELFVIRCDGTRTRAIERTCLTCRSPFLTPIAESRYPNKGRYCSRSCARRAPRSP